MEFAIDEQTITDLEIFESDKQKQSLFKFLDHTRTVGGSDRLHQMLCSPVSDINLLHTRIATIKFFIRYESESIFDPQMLDFIEHYLNQSDYPTTFSSLKAIEKTIRNKLSPTNEFYVKKRGILYTIEFLNSMYQYMKGFDPLESPELVEKYNTQIVKSFSQVDFGDVLHLKNAKKLNPISLEKYDHMFRYTHKKLLRFFLNVVYEYDVFQSLARTITRSEFCLPEIIPSTEQKLEVTGLFHPLIDQAVRNDLSMGKEQNLLFLTGPNMAGKSTFLKALGTAAYLAHIGFPVPAAKMEISLLSGLSTTINIPDNLNLGYSHFYSEVMRIKEVAQTMQKSRNMLVIFDELFRGTNVKDAYEGSVAVISELSGVKTCFFAVSTHIVEVAEELTEKKNIIFRYFEVISKQDMPSYTYKIKEGITDTRLGMHIIRKEKIIDLIRSINE